MMTLDMIMSTDLITITPEEDLAAARALMHDNRIHHLPVVEDGVLVGILSDRDLRRAPGAGRRPPANRAAGPRP